MLKYLDDLMDWSDDESDDEEEEYVEEKDDAADGDATKYTR